MCNSSHITHNVAVTIIGIGVHMEEFVRQPVRGDRERERWRWGMGGEEDRLLTKLFVLWELSCFVEP